MCKKKYSWTLTWELLCVRAGHGWWWVPVFVTCVGALLGAILYELLIGVHHPDSEDLTGVLQQTVELQPKFDTTKVNGKNGIFSLTSADIGWREILNLNLLYLYANYISFKYYCGMLLIWYYNKYEKVVFVVYELGELMVIFYIFILRFVLLLGLLMIIIDLEMYLFIHKYSLFKIM